MSGRSRLEATEVRRAAADRWPEILAHVAGMPMELLDGRHHMCPRCGGKDRFRLIDKEAGAVYCNQCFSQKNGDGFAAIQWSRHVSFSEAVSLVAEYLGFAPPQRTPAPKANGKPGQHTSPLPWDAERVDRWCQVNKPGVTAEAIQANGGVLVRHRHRTTAHEAIALPVFGSVLTDICGWLLFGLDGPLPVGWDKQKKEPARCVDKKLLHCSKCGLMGAWGVERLYQADPSKPLEVWKLESISDVLALWAKIPPDNRERVLVVCGSNGSKAMPDWAPEKFRGHRVYVLHDADSPGEAGANIWGRAITPHAEACYRIRLPFEVTDTHGRDLRDWLTTDA